MEVEGPPWVVVTSLVIGAVGVVVTGVVGPLVVERFKSHRATPESPEPSAIIQRAGDAVTLIQAALVDLQERIRRLEGMQMKDAHDRRG
ncbi:MAG: hypothetical protein WCF33_16365 [Pseudonocardiaceae bacterium]